MTAKRPTTRPAKRAPLPARTKAEVIERDGMVCQLCGRAVRRRPRGEGPADDLIEFDHITEWAWGGTDEPDNLRVACARCNRSRPRQGAPSLPIAGTYEKRERYPRPRRFRPGVDRLTTSDRPTRLVDPRPEHKKFVKNCPCTLCELVRYATEMGVRE